MQKPNSHSTDNLLKTLDSAVQNAFEGLFFMEAVPESAAPVISLDGCDGLEATLSIRGSIAGELSLQISMESAYRLANALPSPLDEISREDVSDLLAELSNTIGGRLAAGLSPDGEAFDMSIPKVLFTKLSPQDATQLLRHYRVDFGSIRFLFRMEHESLDKEPAHAHRKAL